MLLETSAAVAEEQHSYVERTFYTGIKRGEQGGGSIDCLRMDCLIGRLSFRNAVLSEWTMGIKWCCLYRGSEKSILLVVVWGFGMG
jgi:hypothetical protein